METNKTFGDPGKHVTASLNIGRGVPSDVISDGLRVRQILSNLFTNALKFTDNGSVDVYIDVQESETKNHMSIKISVQDSGIGISEENIKNIFKPFTQFHTDRNVGGTGLGMIVAKQLCTQMGGGLDCTSVIGEGSWFIATIVVPGSIVDNPVKRVFFNDSIRIHGDFNSNSPMGRKYVDIYEPIFSMGDFHESKSPVILIIDDNEINRTVLSKMLECLGIHAQQSSSGEDGISISKIKHFDLIFIDMYMPGIDGITTSSIIRSSGMSSDAKLLMLSAKTIEESTDISRVSCFDDFLSKPISKQVLVKTLLKFLSKPGIEWCKRHVTSTCNNEELQISRRRSV